MNALADYGSSSGEDSDGDDVGPSSSISLPKPSRIRQATALSTDDKLDSTVQRHDWELKEAPKAPPKSKKKTIIALPELRGDSDDEMEETPLRAAEPGAAAAGKTKLLSMLPAPTAKGGGGPGLVLSKPISKATVSTAPGKPEVKKPMTTASMMPYALAKKARLATKEEEEETIDPTDFFGPGASAVGVSAGLPPMVVRGMDSPPPIEEEEVDDEYALPAEVEYVQEPAGPSDAAWATPLDAAAEVHPSQMYNFAGGVPAAFAAAERAPGMSEEDAQELVYKNETEAWGRLRPAGGGTLEMKSVNVADALGPNVREKILKNMSYRPTSSTAAVPAMDDLPGKKKRKRGEDEPDRNARRKHQITYLAFQAKAREEALKEEWSQNKYSRRQSQQKYGF